MKEKILTKPKTICNTTWAQTSNLNKEHKNHNLPGIRPTAPVDVVEEEIMASVTNADCKEKLVSSTGSEVESGAVIRHDRLQLSLDFDTGSSGCRSSISTSTSKSTVEDRGTVEDKDRCPPGGKECVVVYTTSLRGIRKTFEECNTIRFLLESFRVVYSERDVSMHLAYRDELWRILGGRVVPPRLFIRGRYIGGADEVVGLHEKGMLQNLLQGIPLSPSSCPCRGCAGMRFVLCCSCNGSRKVIVPEEAQAQVQGVNNGTGTSSSSSSMRCPDCNENGLIKCSICS